MQWLAKGFDNVSGTLVFESAASPVEHGEWTVLAPLFASVVDACFVPRMVKQQEEVKADRPSSVYLEDCCPLPFEIRCYLWVWCPEGRGRCRVRGPCRVSSICVWRVFLLHPRRNAVESNRSRRLSCASCKDGFRVKKARNRAEV